MRIAFHTSLQCHCSATSQEVPTTISSTAAACITTNSMASFSISITGVTTTLSITTGITTDLTTDLTVILWKKSTQTINVYWKTLYQYITWASYRRHTFRPFKVSYQQLRTFVQISGCRWASYDKSHQKMFWLLNNYPFTPDIPEVKPVVAEELVPELSSRIVGDKAARVPRMVSNMS